MMQQDLKRKINWRQIVIHVIASWFLIHAFYTFSILYDTKLIEVVRNSKPRAGFAIWEKSGIAVSDPIYFLLVTELSYLAGLLFAFITSLVISIKRHWFWVNSLIVLVATCLLNRFDLLSWDYLRRYFWYPGQLINNVKIEFAVNGTILLTISLLFFFSGRLTRFIENRRITSPHQSSPSYS